MARLPIPGSDDGHWGEILNDFLSQELNPIGPDAGKLFIRTNGTLDAKYVKPGDGIPATDLHSDIQSQLTDAQSAVQSVNGKTGTAVTLAAADVGALAVGQRGAVNGVAGLGSDGKVPASQLPVISGGSSTFRVDDESAVGDGVADDYGAITSALTKALDVAASGETGVVEFSPGKTYLLGAAGATNGALKLRPNLSGRMVINLNGATIKLSADTPRFLDLAPKAADYDTWQHIYVLGGFGGEQGQIDSGNMGGVGHIILGNFTNSGFDDASRQNVKDILVRDIRVFNAKTSSYQSTGTDGYSTTHRAGVYIASRQTPGEATQTKLTDIICENLRIEGANNGIVCAAVGTGGNYVNVFLDRILYRRCWHDTGGFGGTKDDVVPSGNFAAGSRGRGGWCRVVECDGLNGGDIGIELNGFQLAEVVGCRVRDARTSCYYHTNFAPPDYPGAAVYRVRGCKAERVNEYNTKGVAVRNPDTGVAASDIEVIDFHFHSRYAGDPSPLGNGAISLMDAKCGRVVLENVTSVIENWTHSSATTLVPTSIMVRIQPREAGASTTLSMRGIHVREQGVHGAGAGTLSWTGIELDLKDGLVDIDDVAFYVDLSGITTTGFKLMTIGTYGGWGVPNTVRGEVRHLRLAKLAFDGTAMRGVEVAPTATLTLPRPLYLDDIDLALMPVARELVIDGTQNGKVIATRTGWRAGSTVKPVPATVTLDPSPAIYSNGALVPVRAVVRGGAVTTLELSVDSGTTWYDLGVTAGAVRMQVGDQLRVTYTAAPTLDIIPEA